jgi:hypothetical protein
MNKSKIIDEISQYIMIVTKLELGYGIGRTLQLKLN